MWVRPCSASGQPAELTHQANGGTSAASRRGSWCPNRHSSPCAAPEENCRASGAPHGDSTPSPQAVRPRTRARMLRGLRSGRGLGSLAISAPSPGRRRSNGRRRKNRAIVACDRQRATTRVERRSLGKTALPGLVERCVPRMISTDVDSPNERWARSEPSISLDRSQARAGPTNATTRFVLHRRHAVPPCERLRTERRLETRRTYESRNMARATSSKI